MKEVNLTEFLDETDRRAIELEVNTPKKHNQINC